MAAPETNKLSFRKSWGIRTPLLEHDTVRIDHAHIRKGGHCSKHYHETQSNLFYVVYGKLQVDLFRMGDGAGEFYCYYSRTLELGDSMEVPRGVWHKFRALEETDMIEIYRSPCSESDIQRDPFDKGGLDRPLRDVDVK